MSESREQNSAYEGDMDPEIAELIGIDDESPDGAPEFGDLFGGDKSATEVQKEHVDLGRKTFPSITKTEEAAKPFFLCCGKGVNTL